MSLYKLSPFANSLQQAAKMKACPSLRSSALRALAFLIFTAFGLSAHAQPSMACPAGSASIIISPNLMKKCATGLDADNNTEIPNNAGIGTYGPFDFQVYNNNLCAPFKVTMAYSSSPASTKPFVSANTVEALLVQQSTGVFSPAIDGQNRICYDFDVPVSVALSAAAGQDFETNERVVVTALDAGGAPAAMTGNYWFHSLSAFVQPRINGTAIPNTTTTVVGTTLDFTVTFIGPPVAAGDVGFDNWRVVPNVPVKQICVTYESSPSTISNIAGFDAEEWHRLDGCLRSKALCAPLAQAVPLPTCTLPGVPVFLNPGLLINPQNDKLASDDTEIPNNAGIGTYGPYNYVNWHTDLCKPYVVEIDYKSNPASGLPFASGNRLDGALYRQSAVPLAAPVANGQNEICFNLKNPAPLVIRSVSGTDLQSNESITITAKGAGGGPINVSGGYWFLQNEVQINGAPYPGGTVSASSLKYTVGGCNDVGFDVWWASTVVPATQLCITYTSTATAGASFGPFDSEEYYIISTCAQLSTNCCPLQALPTLLPTLTCTAPATEIVLQPGLELNPVTNLLASNDVEIPNNSPVASYGPYDFGLFSTNACQPYKVSYDFKSDPASGLPYMNGDRIDPTFIRQGTAPWLSPVVNGQNQICYNFMNPTNLSFIAAAGQDLQSNESMTFTAFNGTTAVPMDGGFWFVDNDMYINNTLYPGGIVTSPSLKFTNGGCADYGYDNWWVETTLPVTQVCVTYTATAAPGNHFYPWNTEEWYYINTCARLTSGCCMPVTLPANQTSQVACPALAVQPTPPVVLNQFGAPIVPTGPVITNLPNPLTCEGTRAYAWTYLDCSNIPKVWTFTYTVERNPFTVPAGGAATVACPALTTTQPTPPIVADNCGLLLNPAGPVISANPVCEGTRTYTWTYTDCEGNTLPWVFTYTVERNDFTVPADGAATVACPVNATQPTPPVVLSNCGETIVPTGPVISATPACEGIKTYTWTYTDCEGNNHPWVFTYTIERNDFTFPANATATVACPVLAVQPVPPVVLSNCGETITPTGPVVVNVPAPLTCEGTRTYTWTYTDCEGNTHPWSFTYTVERLDFTVPANGAALVACPDQTDVVPTPPVVLSNCGEVLTPVLVVSVKPFCEGTRTYKYTYTDCEGNTHDWLFTYTVEYLDFSVPASVVSAVECPVNAFQPTPPTVFDNCGKLLAAVGPVITKTNNANGCEGSRRYEWTYTDCEGNSHTWSRTFNFLYSADFFAPADEEFPISCLDFAVPPVPQTLYDFCDLPISVSGPTVTESISGCTGWRKYTYVYKDCGGHSHPWSFTYMFDDTQAPTGICPSNGNNGGTGSGINMNISNLACLDDLPCPEDYDFAPIVKSLLTSGSFVDDCSGHDLVVTLDSWSATWECSDPDGDGIFTFGRTYYFSIADQCGNEFPDLCSVTFSGPCEPFSPRSQQDWGSQQGEEGGGEYLGLIEELLSQGAIVIGGGRSLTLTEAQCIVDLLPGQGGVTELSDCQQLNCVGCNPMTPNGIKNMLAGNAIALELNLRNSSPSAGNQTLDCIEVHPCIVNCTGIVCVLQVFDQNGVQHTFPYTVDGLNTLTNQYLGGDLNLNSGQSVIYGTAINQTVDFINNYGALGQAASCDQGAGAPIVGSGTDKALPATGNVLTTTGKVDFSMAPNPTTGLVDFKLAQLAETQDVTVTIFNSLGQQMLRKDFGNVKSVNEQIDLGNLGNGLFIVSVKAGGQRFEQKLVVQQ